MCVCVCVCVCACARVCVCVGGPREIEQEYLKLETLCRLHHMCVYTVQNSNH